MENIQQSAYYFIYVKSGKCNFIRLTYFEIFFTIKYTIMLVRKETLFGTTVFVKN